ncbi:hypothetical protein Tco_0481668 [Tanacetum coccineum]
MEFLSEFRNRSDGGMIVPVDLLGFAKGAWNRYVKSKEGMPTSRLYNFGKYAPVCLTYASSQSKHIQILPKRYFDGFKKKDLFDFDALEKYEVKLYFIEDVPRGFCGINWTDFLVRENVNEGQKMVVCHAGGFRFNVTVFDFNGVAIETFFLVLVDNIEWF